MSEWEIGEDEWKMTALAYVCPAEAFNASLRVRDARMVEQVAPEKSLTSAERRAFADRRAERDARARPETMVWFIAGGVYNGITAEPGQIIQVRHWNTAHNFRLAP